MLIAISKIGMKKKTSTAKTTEAFKKHLRCRHARPRLSCLSGNRKAMYSRRSDAANKAKTEKKI